MPAIIPCVTDTLQKIIDAPLFEPYRANDQEILGLQMASKAYIKGLAPEVFDELLAWALLSDKDEVFDHLAVSPDYVFQAQARYRAYSLLYLTLIKDSRTIGAKLLKSKNSGCNKAPLEGPHQDITPLIRAVIKQQDWWVNTLCQSPYLAINDSISSGPYAHLTAFWLACRLGSLKAVETLLLTPHMFAEQAPLAGPHQGLTPLMAAVAHNQAPVVAKLLMFNERINRNAYVEAGPHKGSNVLSIAATDNAPECMALLLSEPELIAVNAPDKRVGIYQQTATWIAAADNKPVLLKLLLTHPQVDPNSSPIRGAHEGKNPVWVAARNGNTECLNLLMAHPLTQLNASPEKGLLKGKTPLWAAVMTQQLDCARALLKDASVVIHMQNARLEDSPLNAAAIKMAHLELTELLCEHVLEKVTAERFDKNNELFQNYQSWLTACKASIDPALIQQNNQILAQAFKNVINRFHREELVPKLIWQRMPKLPNDIALNILEFAFGRDDSYREIYAKVHKKQLSRAWSGLKQEAIDKALHDLDSEILETGRVPVEKVRNTLETQGLFVMVNGLDKLTSFAHSLEKPCKKWGGLNKKDKLKDSALKLVKKPWLTLFEEKRHHQIEASVEESFKRDLAESVFFVGSPLPKPRSLT